MLHLTPLRDVLLLVIHSRLASMAVATSGEPLRNPFRRLKNVKEGRKTRCVVLELPPKPVFIAILHSSTFTASRGVLRVDVTTGINGDDYGGTGTDRALIFHSMSRMGVSRLLPLCAFLLTITLYVNAFPLPKIDSTTDVIDEKVKADGEHR